MWRDVALEPADHEQRDEHEHGGEGEGAEDFEGDVPFAVPLKGGREIVEGLIEMIDRELGGGRAEGAGV